MGTVPSRSDFQASFSPTPTMILPPGNVAFNVINSSISTIPEPSTCILLGLSALGFYRGLFFATVIRSSDLV
jgi:hypothetical protein